MYKTRPSCFRKIYFYLTLLSLSACLNDPSTRHRARQQKCARIKKMRASHAIIYAILSYRILSDSPKSHQDRKVRKILQSISTRIHGALSTIVTLANGDASSMQTRAVGKVNKLCNFPVNSNWSVFTLRKGQRTSTQHYTPNGPRWHNQKVSTKQMKNVPQSGRYVLCRLKR